MNIKTKPSFWTEERVEELRYYINKTNKSVPEIMKIFGITRDAMRMQVYRTLGIQMPKGDRDPRARKFLTDKKVKKIRKDFDNKKMTQEQIAKKHGVTQCCVHNIGARKSYKWVE